MAKTKVVELVEIKKNFYLPTFHLKSSIKEKLWLNFSHLKFKILKRPRMEKLNNIYTFVVEKHFSFEFVKGLKY